jgi:gamma-glutamyltranspeptidase/glutathione hydrolase
VHGVGQVLQPAIELAESGFPVSPVTAYHWEISAPQLRGPGKASLLNPEGRAPAAGEIQKNPDLAATFRTVAEHGAHEGVDPWLESAIHACHGLTFVICAPA